MKKNNKHAVLTSDTDKRQQTIMLFEKGLISAQAVLDAFGFDPKQEMIRKKSDAVEFNSDNTIQNYKEQDHRIMLNRIESARRNVEVVAKTVLSFTGEGGKDIQKLMLEVLMSNLKIMNETENIK